MAQQDKDLMVVTQIKVIIYNKAVAVAVLVQMVKLVVMADKVAAVVLVVEILQ